jgi:hypothetical protein
VLATRHPAAAAAKFAKAEDAAAAEAAGGKPVKGVGYWWALAAEEAALHLGGCTAAAGRIGVFAGWGAVVVVEGVVGAFGWVPMVAAYFAE